MAERQDPRYEETDDPRNPPNAVTNKGARRAAVWAYLGPIIALFVIIGIAMLYWARRDPGRVHDENSLNPAIGTSGEKLKDDNSSRDLEQGGGDPRTRPGNTADELKNRGTDR
jgi:hypothetical protein